MENIKDRLYTEEGVSCIVCHVREGKILVAKLPKKISEHRYIEAAYMQSSEFCASCHQFPFPVGTGMEKNKKFHLSTQAMQNTYEEWKESYYADKKTCQSCHMPEAKVGKYSYKSHSFLGGHSKSYLSETFEAEFFSVEENRLLLRLKAKQIGHAFPTGDLFRTLEIRLLDKNKQEIWTHKLRYKYIQNPEYPKNPNISAKKLESKEILLPPYANEDSTYEKSFALSRSDLDKIRYYRLLMVYTHEKNSPGNEVPHEDRELLFLENEFKLQKNTKEDVSEPKSEG